MKRTLLDKLGDFVLGKGFYIVLFLCVATIGISGYYIIRTVDAPSLSDLEPVTGNPTIVLPDESTPAVRGEQIPKDTLQTARPAVPAAPVEEKKPESQPEQPSASQQAPAPAPKPSAPAVYTWPVKGEVIRGFSVDALAYDTTMGDWRTHGGIDIAAQEGLKVLCISDGTVRQVLQDELMGTTVVVEHPEGLVSTYANLAPEAAVEVSQEVDTGTVLGTVGATAIAEVGQSAHLHLEMTLNGQPVDPTGYLPGK